MSEERSERRDLLAEFEGAYETTPPWDIGAPRPASRPSRPMVACGDECSTSVAALESTC